MSKSKIFNKKGFIVNPKRTFYCSINRMQNEGTIKTNGLISQTPAKENQLKNWKKNFIRVKQRRLGFASQK
jgi:hypothetical protein